MTLLLLNLIFGVIIDTFAELRSAREQRDVEMKVRVRVRAGSSRVTWR